MTWQDMSTAPRDGTVIELRCNYGTRPWYARHRWTDEIAVYGRTWIDEKGREYRRDFDVRIRRLPKPTWLSLDQPNCTVDDERYLTWRPIVDSDTYVDPTNGAQYTQRYWGGL